MALPDIREYNFHERNNNREKKKIMKGYKKTTSVNIEEYKEKKGK
jgi:hypothetical protein